MSWEFCDYLYPMQLILPCIYAALFISLIFRMNFFVIPSVTKMNLVLLFIVKLFAAFAVKLVYSYYYSGADFNSYFSDGSLMIHNLMSHDHRPYLSWTGSFQERSFEYSSRIMIILNACLQLFSFGNVYVHFLFFCFFSFMGLTALLKMFLIHFPDKKQIIIALFFIPGVLFWGSAPMKESVIIGVLGLLIYCTDFGLRKKYNLKGIIFVFILILFLILIKIYILIILMPGLICNIIVSRTSTKLWILKYSVVAATLIILAGLTARIDPRLNILKQISDKQVKAISEAKGGVFLVSDKNFISVDYKNAGTILMPVTDSTFKIIRGSSYLKWDLENMSDTTFVTDSKDTAIYRQLYKVEPANSMISIKRIKPSLKEFILYSPVAFFNTLIHPSLSEIHSWFQLICSIENLSMILLIFCALFFFDKNILEKKEIVFFCLTFSVALYVLIGITTPAIGAMVRYKTIGEMLLAAVCFIMIDQEKFKRIVFRKITDIKS